MNRRTFLTGSLAATGLAETLSVPALAAERGGDDPQPQEYYELRQYRLRQAAHQKRLDDYLRDAALPAMKRLGIGPVGVFQVMVGADSATTYVLIPHPSAESLVTLGSRLMADAQYQADGAAFLTAPAGDPAFHHIESWLLKAFTGMPKLAVPAAAKEQKPRLFELRTYFNPSDKARVQKVEAFNTGEIALFQKAGFHPVFFGETLVGSDQPHLTYLLAFEDMPAWEKYWAAFRSDPDFRKMLATPGFGDMVTHITNVLLRPAPYSQI